MTEEKKVEVYYSRDRLHPEKGWKPVYVEVKPMLVCHIVSTKGPDGKPGYRIERRYE
jgi:hypothetical protein